MLQGFFFNFFLASNVYDAGYWNQCYIICVLEIKCGHKFGYLHIFRHFFY